MREEARARQGIETLVIGENPFAFVEVIRRLEGGAAVALLVDRPHPANAVTVRLFGKPFAASIAPAELARASGCALLPACILRRKAGCEVRILPELGYDRRALGSRAARAVLAQEIMNVFEPAIRRDVEQWFHFVPLWARAEEGEER
jgi:lauroyl/myristoyl acyltransferase